MDSSPRGDDGRADPLTAKPDCGNAGDFARWDDAQGRWVGEHDEAERVETAAAYEGHRRRFVASGGEAGRFDTLHLLAAARLSARRVLSVLGAAKGEGWRPATEHEVRTTMAGMAAEAIEAQGRGRFRAFRRMLWPFGSPLND